MQAPESPPGCRDDARGGEELEMADRAELRVELRDKLEEIAEHLKEAVEAAREGVRIAEGIGGETERCVGGQLEMYLARNVEAFIDEEPWKQIGNVESLLRLVDEYEADEKEREENDD